MSGFAGQADELNIEDQGRVGWNDAPKPTFTVCHMGRDGECTLFADTHPDDTFIPAFNDLPDAKGQRQRLITIVTRVEFIAVGKKLSGIMNLDRVALPRFGDTIRRFERRFYVQFLWGLLRQHEQGKGQRQAV